MPTSRRVLILFRLLLLHNEKNVNVCLKAFCAVLGFGQKRLFVLRQKMKTAANPVTCIIEPDKREKHGNKKRFPEEIQALVHNHISDVNDTYSDISGED